MPIIRCAILPIISVFLTNCAIHPLPDNTISKTDTFTIVKRLRCEAKQEVINQVHLLLLRSPSEKTNRIHPKDVLNKGVIDVIDKEYIAHGPTYMDETTGQIQEHHNIGQLIRLFSNSGISYNFRFEITENNEAVGGASLRLPFTNGIANFLTDGSLRLTRVGKREFTMSENFSDLAKLQCGDGEDRYGPRNVFLAKDQVDRPLPKRFIYPLTGSSGMGKIMRDFLRLAEMGGGKGNFSDTITFTTTAGLSLEANVAVNPGPVNRLRLASAVAAAGASRQDIHEVVVTLAFPNKASLAKPPTTIALRNAVNKLKEDARLEAAIAQCIQRAEARENRFQVLRNVPPEVYCVQFAKDILQL